MQFPSPQDAAFAVALQGDGKIVAAGRTGQSADFGLARYNADGSLDGTFGGDGTVAVDLGGTDIALGVAVTPTGAIVAVGEATVGGNRQFGVARLLSNGARDPAFSGDGVATFDFGAAFERAEAIVVQPDGKIVIGGWRQTATSDLGLVVRLTVDGAPDPSFSGDGVTEFEFGYPAGNLVTGVTLQRDGKIVAAGAHDQRTSRGRRRGGRGRRRRAHRRLRQRAHDR